MSKSCSATSHDFEKFDDATIFCRKCGEQRVMDVQALIRALPLITYLPCPGQHVYPYVYPTWQPTPWYGTTITSGTVSVGSTVVLNPSDINFTLTEGGS